MATVEFCNVSKIFPGNSRALQDLNLEITDGELMVLVGPSGCGKSTALRLLAGLEEISRGELRIGGKRVNEQTPQQRNVAMVFQNYSLYPHMTVRKNLEFPLKVKGFSRREIDRQVHRAAEMLGLNDLLQRRPKQLSGGQSQRVAMGRAIVRNPAVFLMDEPLSNLDAKLRVQIRRDIVQLQQQMKTTTVYVTHDQVEAMTLGQRVAVLHAGRLQQVATPHDLYDRPDNTFVAGFIGSPGMNLFTTRLVRNAHGSPSVLLAGRHLEIAGSLLDHYADLNSYLDTRVIAGLRPEAFITQPPTTGKQQEITVTVQSIEPLGHETLLYFAPSLNLKDSRDIQPGQQTNVEIDTDSMVARLPYNLELSADRQLTLSIDMNQIHLFDIHGQRLKMRH